MPARDRILGALGARCESHQKIGFFFRNSETVSVSKELGVNDAFCTASVLWSGCDQTLG